MEIEHQYRACPDISIVLDGYSILPLRKVDIFSIKRWRNNQIRVLRQNKMLTDNDQEKYFNLAIVPSLKELHPKQILFSFMHGTECIGYGGLVHISWEDRRAELSFLVDDRRASNEEIYRRDFLTFIKIIKEVAFNKLSFNRIFTETFDIRNYHISLLEEGGFVLEGTMRQHNIINRQFVNSMLHGVIRSDYIDSN